MAVSWFKRNQKGQSVFEFLVFLPFMLMIYSMTHSMANAIFASINQQKALRGYFYFRTAGNATLPSPTARQAGDSYTAFRQFGMQAYGWMERLDGEQPLAPCFKYHLLFGEDDDDACEEAYSEPTTQHIRVMSVYGICGATYVRNDLGVQSFPLVQVEGNPILRCSRIQ